MTEFRFLVLLTCVTMITAVAAAEPNDLTIGLIGDSTVANTYGWGPALKKRFDQQTKILNFARNGATLDSLSIRLDELLRLKPDYVLIQFGHNDQKRYDTDSYRDKLTSYVQRVTQAGANAIVLSSVTRRNFGEDERIQPRKAGLKASLPFFATAAAAVAKEQDVPFIDLYTMSVKHHNTIGPQATMSYNFEGTDRTHFSPEGANAIAGLIVEELRKVTPEIAEHLIKVMPTDASN